MPSPIMTIVARARFAVIPVLRVSMAGGVAESLPLGLTVSRDYFLSGNFEDDTTAGNGDLVRVIRDALNNNTAGGVFDVTLSNDGRMTIDCNMLFEILLSDPANTLDAGYLGMTAGVDTVQTTSLQSDFCVRTWWVPNMPVYRRNWGEADVVGASDQAANQMTLSYSLGESALVHRQVWLYIDQSRVKRRFASLANDPFNCFEWLWHEGGLSDGCRFRVYEDMSSRDLQLTLPPHRRGVVTCRGSGQEKPWRVEEDQRLTSYEVEVIGYGVP